MKILNDFSTSVEKALTEIDPNWRRYPGLIICGTHTPHDVQKLIDCITVARETGMPFLGICFGHQLAAIEYARNVLGQKDATSEEFGEVVIQGINLSPQDGFIVKKRKEGLKIGLHPTNPSMLNSPLESYWNNYEVLPGFLEMWHKPENFITCQYHPEYQSSKNKPHPLLVKFLELCKNQK